MKFGKYWTKYNDELPKKLQQKTLCYKNGKRQLRKFILKISYKN